ncbi:hypothetical protein [Prevotella sp.]|uniref:hypothetical protein n=1 Tax=Prevotella sp. TaxID=59823 RepID=UPI003FD8FC16
MKKLFLLVIGLVMTVVANAQFEQGKYYCNGSLTGIGLSYSGTEKLNLGIEAKGGYLVADNWMLLAMAGYEHSGLDGVDDKFHAGLGGRFYIIENGLYMGVNTKLVHGGSGYNDLMPGIELGYAFFLGKSVTIEPSVYYDQSIKNHSDYSKVGLKIGVGIYL